MAKQKHGIYPVNVARTIYNNAGGGAGLDVQERFGKPAAAHGRMYRFELVEDIESGDGGETGATTIIKNMSKTATVTESGILVNVDGEIDGARAGFVGTCWGTEGKYWFIQAPCGQICTSTTFIPIQVPLAATIGQEDYEWTPSSMGTVNASSWSASGLPSGFTIDAATGKISGPTTPPGVVGPARTVAITISCEGPETAPGTGDCTATRVVNLVIEE